MTSKLPTGSIDGRLKSYRSLKYDLIDSSPLAYLISRSKSSWPWCDIGCDDSTSGFDTDADKEAERVETSGRGGDVGSSKPFSNIKGMVDGSARLILGGVSIGKKLLLFPLVGTCLLLPNPANIVDALGVFGRLGCPNSFTSAEDPCRPGRVMAEALDRKAGRPGAWSGSVLACVRTGGMSLILDAAELATRAALSAGLSRFIDIFRKNPHFPDFEVDELAVIPIGADRLSSMG